MSDSYKYLDPTHTYTDPHTGVLKNLLNITDHDVLSFVESSVVTKRLQELFENPIKIKDIESLFLIHHHLFKDIYTWAGKKRVVEISRNGKQFFPTTQFETALGYINTLIEAYKLTPKSTRNI